MQESMFFDNIFFFFFFNVRIVCESYVYEMLEGPIFMGINLDGEICYATRIIILVSVLGLTVFGAV